VLRARLATVCRSGSKGGLAQDRDDYLLKKRRDFIDDKDALAAFDFLVNAAICLPHFECRPALQGAAKTFSYKNITSQSRDFAFIVNRKHLRFYVRSSGLKGVPGGFTALKDQFNDAKETAGEWVVDIRSAPEAARLHSSRRSAFGGPVFGCGQRLWDLPLIEDLLL
jgi:hypothetical protein